MTDSERNSRLALARALRESADHSSEQEIRDALSRSYYAVFHVGCVLVGRGLGNHREFLQELRALLSDDAEGSSLMAKIEEIQRLRIQADYQFDAVERYYEGSLGKFQEAAANALGLGREVCQHLLNRITAR